MTRYPRVGRRGPVWLAAAAALVASACGGGGDPGGPAAAEPPTTTTMTTAPPPTGPPLPVDAGAAPPVRVVIPRIGVDAPVVALGLDAAGALEAPHTAADAGWWQAGPEPGERGPAVIAGHVDSRRHPAVFFRLRELVAGDTVDVVRADGTTASFVVERREQHAKAAFPTAAVYGATAGSTLRLITCGGVFDRATRLYVDNVIVFASRR